MKAMILVIVDLPDDSKIEDYRFNYEVYKIHKDYTEDYTDDYCLPLTPINSVETK